jgi:hypothetical protein
LLFFLKSGIFFPTEACTIRLHLDELLVSFASRDHVAKPLRDYKRGENKEKRLVDAPSIAPFESIGFATADSQRALFGIIGIVRIGAMQEMRFLPFH